MVTGSSCALIIFRGSMRLFFSGSLRIILCSGLHVATCKPNHVLKGRVMHYPKLTSLITQACYHAYDLPVLKVEALWVWPTNAAQLEAILAPCTVDRLEAIACGNDPSTGRLDPNHLFAPVAKFLDALMCDTLYHNFCYDADAPEVIARLNAPHVAWQ
jgi:hypothetical protein